MFSVQHGDTALHLVSRMGNKDTVEVLVQKGAQLDSKNNVSIMIIYFKVLGEKYTFTQATMVIMYLISYGLRREIMN